MLQRPEPRLLLGLLLVLVAACGQDERPAVTQGVSVQESGAPCEPPPALGAVPPDALPPGLELPAGALVTAVAEQQGFTLVTGRVEATVAQVLDHFRAASGRAGLVVQRDEDEGRGGKLDFFGLSVESGVTVARLACPGGSTGFTVRTTTV